MNSLSVVIPTHNRAGTLRKALSAYFDQTVRQEIAEIIVVDDGSTDSTGAMVSQFTASAVIPIRYLRQQNKGPAAARNLGIREATAGLILFADDDIIPSPKLVAEHIDWHGRFPELSAAVLGNVTWAEEVNATPFMKWYEAEVLFSYPEIVDQREVDYRYFYSCNISVKRAFLCGAGMFDEDFKTAAWEDIELGFRLQRAGMRLLYNQQACAYHDQLVSFGDACRRYRKSQAAGAIFRTKDAGLQDAQTAVSNGKPLLKAFLGPLCSPIKPIMDSRLPLPGSVYRTMFRIYR